MFIHILLYDRILTVPSLDFLNRAGSNPIVLSLEGSGRNSPIETSKLAKQSRKGIADHQLVGVAKAENN